MENAAHEQAVPRQLNTMLNGITCKLLKETMQLFGKGLCSDIFCNGGKLLRKSVPHLAGYCLL